MELLARNKVKDFDEWKRVFDSQTPAARAAGLHLTQMWRSVDDANNVFFLFEVEDQGRAVEFMTAPTAKAAGEEAGVIDGEYHFLSSAAHP